MHTHESQRISAPHAHEDQNRHWTQSAMATLLLAVATLTGLVLLLVATVNGYWGS